MSRSRYTILLDMAGGAGTSGEFEACEALTSSRVVGWKMDLTKEGKRLILDVVDDDGDEAQISIYGGEGSVGGLDIRLAVDSERAMDATALILAEERPYFRPGGPLDGVE